MYSRVFRSFQISINPSVHPRHPHINPATKPSISKICGLSQLPELRKSSLAIKLLVAFLGLRLLTPCFVSSPNVSNSSSRVPMRAEGEKEGEETWLHEMFARKMPATKSPKVAQIIPLCLSHCPCFEAAIDM